MSSLRQAELPAGGAKAQNGVRLFWFRRDLRLADNRAFSACLKQAKAQGQTVEAVYVHDVVGAGPAAPGAAARCYLHFSLIDLQARLAALGIPLHLRVGDNLGEIESLCNARGVAAVYWNRLPEPHGLAGDVALIKRLTALDIRVHPHEQGTLWVPDSVRKPDGGRYRVFTPFARQARAQLMLLDTQAELCPVPPPMGTGFSAPDTAIDVLGLLDGRAWPHKLMRYWNPGESAAQARLSHFVATGLAAYAKGREFPALDGSSRLSAALHWGEINPWRIVHTLQPALHGAEATLGAERFLTELLWREFAHHLLTAAPDSVSRSLHGGYEALWQSNPEALDRWQRGETGLALVDAGMRELWETGWMHNRVRMVVASFLTKNIGVHWREGAAWFWDTLVDADLASNTMGWQWVAGCGVDAAPYFRVFNPDVQAERFDPQGAYIRRWLGNRPRPPAMLDLKQSRLAALARYQALAAHH